MKNGMPRWKGGLKGGIIMGGGGGCEWIPLPLSVRSIGGGGGARILEPFSGGIAIWGKILYLISEKIVAEPTPFSPGINKATGCFI